MNTADLIETLLNPETYPHPVEVITTIETHISIVFLTGQYAYKLKKPVNFGFLNFSTLPFRKKFCALEVTLNRRTAPELYIGIEKVININNKVCLEPVSDFDETTTSPDIIEYLVKMKQFDPNMVLGRLLNQGYLDNSMISALTLQVSEFHKVAQAVDLESDYGNPEIQLKPMLDNFPSLESYFNNESTKQDLHELLNWTNNQFSVHKPMLQQRKQQGFVRACHGDLHLDNITLIDGQPVLFDGIEFNEYFRWIDVISDLAFLLIDLDFRNQHATSYKILSQYLSQTLDYNGLYLLNFYRVYRTMVRAKITALRAEQLPSKSLEKQHIEQTALNYIQQAISYTKESKAPKCILLQGVSGSGKSYFANQLLEEVGDFKAIILSSDRIRKSLYGIDQHERLSGSEQQNLYSAEMNQKTYHALAENARICLELGFNVIIDATFLKYHHRDKIYQMASMTDADALLFSIEASTETASQAITLRQLLNNNPSDAGVEVMEHQKKRFEPPRHNEKALVLSSDDLRKIFPKKAIQEFMNLPIT